MAPQVILTRDVFEAQMRRLGGLKFPPSDLDTHWEALQDMAEPLLKAAIGEAAKESDEFPSPRMLRVFADRLRARLMPVGPEVDRSMPAPEREIEFPQAGRVLKFQREWRYCCEDCSDTGWLSFVCGQDVVTVGTGDAQREFARHPWSDRAHCGKGTEHLGHSWSTRCGCVHTNPAVIRKRERDIQQASQRVKSKGDAA